MSCDDQELQSILMDDKFEFIGECRFLMPVSSVTLSDLPTILRSVCTEYVIV